MTNCRICGRKLLVGACINLECNSSFQKVKKTSKKSPIASKKIKNKNALPDLTKPIPDKVNSSKYTKKKNSMSLLAYLKYSRAKDQTDHMRQHQLKKIIEAGPFIASLSNQEYISSFGPENSKKRVTAMIDLLGWQIKGQRPKFDKNPERFANRLPSLEKAEKDVQWLNSIVEEYD